MSIWGFREKRWAALVVSAVLGFAPIARAETRRSAACASSRKR